MDPVICEEVRWAGLWSCVKEPQYPLEIVLRADSQRFIDNGQTPTGIPSVEIESRGYETLPCPTCFREILGPRFGG